jgi:hypothetical protein
MRARILPQPVTDEAGHPRGVPEGWDGRDHAIDHAIDLVEILESMRRGAQWMSALSALG